jgi:hypothetical protein
VVLQKKASSTSGGVLLSRRLCASDRCFYADHMYEIGFDQSTGCRRFGVVARYSRKSLSLTFGTTSCWPSHRLRAELA